MNHNSRKQSKGTWDVERKGRKAKEEGNWSSIPLGNYIQWQIKHVPPQEGNWPPIPIPVIKGHPWRGRPVAPLTDWVAFHNFSKFWGRKTCPFLPVCTVLVTTAKPKAQNMWVTWSDKSGTLTPHYLTESPAATVTPLLSPLRAMGQLPQRHKQQHLPKPVHSRLRTYSSYKDRLDTKIMEENSEQDDS